MYPVRIHSRPNLTTEHNENPATGSSRSNRTDGDHKRNESNQAHTILSLPTNLRGEKGGDKLNYPPKGPARVRKAIATMLTRVSTYEQDNAQPATELRDTTKTLEKLPRVEKKCQRPREVLGIGGGQLRRRGQYDH